MKIKLVATKKDWEAFSLSQKPNVFLQSFNWGEFHQKIGKSIFRLGFWEGKKLVGVALIIKEEAKRGVYLSCPGGPVINWQKKEVFLKFIEYLKNLSQEEGAAFIRIRPSILSSEENRSLFQKAGFVNAPMHMHAETTWQLALSGSEEELLSGMRKTTRYLIRRALREGVEVKTTKDPAMIETLYQLQMETARRHRFVPFPQDFLEAQFKIFTHEDQALLFVARYQKKILAVSMIIFYGDTAVYHYSGSSSLFPKVPASYLIQWEAIKEAKRRNCLIYNFWGIAPSDDPRHRFAGVTTFKKGFGGQRVDYLHAQDLPLGGRYWFTFGFETLRRLLRRL